jgi:hypothetical protein
MATPVDRGVVAGMTDERRTVEEVKKDWKNPKT